MSIITLPAALPIAQWSFGQYDVSLSEMSESTGNIAARNVGGPARWLLSMGSPDAMDRATAALWEGMLLQLRGRVNHLAAWDFTRAAPRGTMRGTLTLNAGVAAGDVTASITGGVGQAGTTLLAGDLIGIGTVGLGTSQVVEVMADATANGSGVISVTFEPPLRAASSGGAAVTWDKPLVYFKRSTGRTTWRAAPGELKVGGYTFDGLEQWN